MIQLSYLELFVLLVLWLVAGGEMGFLLAHFLEKRRHGLACKQCGAGNLRHQKSWRAEKG